MYKELGYIEFIGNVSAGLPMPILDCAGKVIDLRKYLKLIGTSLCLAKIKGDSMINANIPNDAIVIIDKAVKPSNNSIIIASVNGEKIIKYVVKTYSGLFLLPGNPHNKPIKIAGEMEFAVCGVVTHINVKSIK